MPSWPSTLCCLQIVVLCLGGELSRDLRVERREVNEPVLGLARANTPSSPRMTPKTSGESGKFAATMSACSYASTGVLATRPPASTNGCTACLAAVVPDQVEIRGHEVRGHGVTHDLQPDEGDRARVAQPSPSCASRPVGDARSADGPDDPAMTGVGADVGLGCREGTVSILSRGTPSPEPGLP